MTKIIVCVCGAGTMGSGIAQAAAQAGFYTLLYEPVSQVLGNAKNRIENNLKRLVEKNKIDESEKETILQRIQFFDDIQFCQADVFIEAIVEKADIKINLFNQLAELNHSECVFATNTSSLSVTAIAEKIQKPERVIGMHFFNPATIMKLVEVVNTPFTNTQTTKTIIELAKAMGKTPVLCKDAPGFIVNHVARPYYIESLRLAEERISNFETIDKLLEATGFKMGPFHLMDLIGNDVNYAVSCSVYEQMGKPERLKPSFIQEAKVKDGKLGKKTGEGYFVYQS
ncbi:MAG: 3-hydroxybutyryl-CoA dehydrogenase [Chitinophagaceae bacterium]|nr:3-hydroxybutyryl-CoA dehydrogenase [Chitinophagaceae bacterium]HMX78461.1 3-hydroxyacyl-CoA dehydrogenase NAD-binding domain-containing protein [Chitinophagaceae bacterium]HNA18758.1 3-hydroxyacyl-CoA dehydrogenase NAD-binding domain-containing protein [Chitinophagaceae bacterium]HND95459.1 3-hydroxyacyl-CoA dehydrogenase NAD-binding domain-containing protein [Chitinophagaceae bacterium]HNJ25022.1 3-hydroxyacyl-CoA dehydrogenase NAD-binding domain-containing protein [Chitinophagaceae bacteri